MTISPLAQLSTTVLTSTSVTVTAQYNVDYTVSVVATNCAGAVQLLSTALGLVSIIVLYTQFQLILSGNCPALTNPMNGAFGPVASRLPGSTVTIQCDDELFPEGIMTATCLATGKWDEEIVCRGKCIH